MPLLSWFLGLTTLELSWGLSHRLTLPLVIPKLAPQKMAFTLQTPQMTTPSPPHPARQQSCLYPLVLYNSHQITTSSVWKMTRYPSPAGHLTFSCTNLSLSGYPRASLSLIRTLLSPIYKVFYHKPRYRGPVMHLEQEDIRLATVCTLQSSHFDLSATPHPWEVFCSIALVTPALRLLHGFLLLFFPVT